MTVSLLSGRLECSGRKKKGVTVVTALRAARKKAAPRNLLVGLGQLHPHRRHLGLGLLLLDLAREGGSARGRANTRRARGRANMRDGEHPPTRVSVAPDAKPDDPTNFAPLAAALRLCVRLGWFLSRDFNEFSTTRRSPRRSVCACVWVGSCLESRTSSLDDAPRAGPCTCARPTATSPARGS